MRRRSSTNRDAEVAQPGAPFLQTRPEGLYAPAFEAYLDPAAAALRAILTHAHSDHAAAGHGEIWGTPETVAIYRHGHPANGPNGQEPSIPLLT